MLRLRILTVVVVLPLFLGAMFFLPNPWWSVALVLPLLVAGHEWARLAGFGQPAEAVFLGVMAAGCAFLWTIDTNTIWYSDDAGTAVHRILYILSAVFWCVFAPCWLRLKLITRNPMLLAIVGLIVLLPTWVALVQLQINAALLLALLGVVWIADSAAFFSGRALGRHKLAFAISPGKTWEGVGGAFAAVAVYALLLHTLIFPAWNLWLLVAALLGIACLGIVGDLFESWLKRNAGVKDSGSIFPGHGGMLDRIDAITAALPMAALIFRGS